MFALSFLLVAPLAVAAGPFQKRINGFATYYNVQTGNAWVSSLGGLPFLSVIINRHSYSAVAPVAHL